MNTQLLFISGAEIFIILIVILLLFGAKKFLKWQKVLGKVLRSLKKLPMKLKKKLPILILSKTLLI